MKEDEDILGGDDAHGGRDDLAPLPIDRARSLLIERICDCECTSRFDHSSTVCRQYGIDLIDALIASVRAEPRPEYCPCEDGEPNPCPACGARAEDGVCRALRAGTVPPQEHAVTTSASAAPESPSHIDLGDAKERKA